MTTPPFPTTATLTDRVGRVLGLNPGMMTGPGTNTYLVGLRAPILIDTGAGVPDYVPLLERYLEGRGFTQPSRVLLTHRHRDHLGGVAQLRARFAGLRVAKMRHKDAELPEPMDDLRDGEIVHGDGVTLRPVYTPGHASDHLCYYLEEERALFTGDVILGGSTTDVVDFAVSLQGRIDDLHRAVDEVAAGLTRVDRRVDGAVTNTSVVRYDAYEDAGGQQSASFAFLDSNRTGTVVTAIQGRDYARVYVKELERGQPNLALSPEEAEAVERAMAR